NRSITRCCLPVPRSAAGRWKPQSNTPIRATMPPRRNFSTQFTLRRSSRSPRHRRLPLTQRRSRRPSPAPEFRVTLNDRYCPRPPMFFQFFDELRAAKIPVTLKEYLSLMNALDKDVIDMKIDEFYYLSRTALIK